MGQSSTLIDSLTAGPIHEGAGTALAASFPDLESGADCPRSGGQVCELSLAADQCHNGPAMMNDLKAASRDRVKVCVLGVGSLGKEHARIYSKLAAAKQVEFI